MRKNDLVLNILKLLRIQTRLFELQQYKGRTLNWINNRKIFLEIHCCLILKLINNLLTNQEKRNHEREGVCIRDLHELQLFQSEITCILEITLSIDLYNIGEFQTPLTKQYIEVYHRIFISALFGEIF